MDTFRASNSNLRNLRSDSAKESEPYGVGSGSWTTDMFIEVSKRWAARLDSPPRSYYDSRHFLANS
jgi:hypothetical protein